METETNTGETVVEPTMEQVANGITAEVTPAVPELAPEPLKVETSEGESPTPVDTEQDAIQKRINKITADKYAEKRRADALQAKLDAQTVVKPVESVDAPKLEDFDYDDEAFQSAVIQYQVNEQVNKALTSQQEATTKQQTEQARQAAVNDFSIKEAEYVSAHPEYSEEITSLPAFPEETLNAIYELGPKVSHYLAKHLDVASEVANASTTMAAVKLGQISMGLSADTKTIKPTKAPEPVVTIAGGAAVTKSQEDMSMDEIMALP